MQQRTVLIIDDEPKLREVLSVALEQMGYRTVSAAGGQEALALFDTEEINLVLCDLRMPGMTGRELLREIRLRDPNLPVIIMTAYTSLKDAVQIIKQGAFDYISKPFDLDELEAAMTSALRLHAALSDNQRLREELAGKHRFDQMVGNSPAFRKVLQAISDVCESNASVLISGESGTGKELAARAVHYNSTRKNGPFVTLNCAAIPENLLESELFGHVKGAFTGATSNRAGRFTQADGGTIFLDEIGDMPLNLQVKILRVLQEKTYEPVGGNKTLKADVRLISASNKDLPAAVAAGLFRQDLFYRINVFPIAMPPLRERGEDIPLLAQYLAARIAADIGKRFTGFTPEAMRVMRAYSWPGNIRELRNCVERAILVAREPTITAGDLPEYARTARHGAPSCPRTPSFPMDLEQELAKTERELIMAALSITNGVQVKAAEILRVSERSLWHRIKKLNIKIYKTLEQPDA